MPNKLSQFWNELKRRNVIRVITVYAGAAFVIIELINNITEPLRLPEWTPTLVIVLLAIGFPVVIIFSWIYDIHPEGGMVKTESADQVKTADQAGSSKGWKIATYVSVVIIIGLIASNIFGVKRGPRIDKSLAKSIAVLPFINLSGEDEREFICEGLTEDLINNLFKVGSFDKVSSYSNVKIYRDTDKSLSEIAEELGVNYILESTYKWMGEEIEITTRLIEPESDNPIWSNYYNLPYGEISGIPGEIALHIANNLRAFISEDLKQNIKNLPTENMAAYELVQQIKSIYNTNPFQERSTIIDLAEKAIALDPDYADPYAWRGIMIIADGFFWGPREMNVVGWEALKNIDKALKIDPNNFMASFGMDCIDLFLKWDYVDMVERSEKLGDQLSSDIYLSWAYALFQLKMGQFEDALSSNGPEGFFDLTAFCQILLGNTDYVRNQVKERIDSLGFTFYGTAAEIYIWLQDFDQAILLADSVIASGQDPDGWFPKQQASLAVSYFKTGRTDLARDMIGKLIKRCDTTSVGSPAYFTGWYYSWIGELDSAFYWLDEAVESRSTEVSWLKVDPAFKSLTDDPRYWDLYERTGHKAYDDYMASRKE